MSAKYDGIGVNYAELRRADPRIAGLIESTLGSAQTVLNVGAGTGSYEPADRLLIAAEPSPEMIRKRSPALPRRSWRARKSCRSETGASTPRWRS